MKELGKPNYCLGIQFDHLPDGILISQSTYTKKIIKQFNMKNAHPVNTPMDLRSLDPTKDMFRKRLKAKPIISPVKPYLSAILGTLKYLANQTRPAISFTVNLLARHFSNSWKSSKQTLTTTSSNHSEIIALYEACRECVWLCQLIDHINQHTGRPLLAHPTIIYEENRPCVHQILQGFIKGD